MPPHRVFVPDAEVLGRAALLSGILCRLQGYEKDGKLRALQDCVLFLQAQKLGLLVLTANVSDYDILLQLIPAGRAAVLPSEVTCDVNGVGSSRATTGPVTRLWQSQMPDTAFTDSGTGNHADRQAQTIVRSANNVGGMASSATTTPCSRMAAARASSHDASMDLLSRRSGRLEAVWTAAT